MQQGGEPISWISVIERGLGGFLASLLFGIASYIPSRLAAKFLQRRAMPREVVYEGAWSRYLRFSPIAISIAMMFGIIAFAVSVPYFFVGFVRGSQWYVIYGGSLVVLVVVNWVREFYASGLMLKEAAFQALYEVLGVLRGQVVSIIEEASVRVRFDHVVRCNIMIYHPKSEELEMKFWNNFDDDKKDVDKGRHLPVSKGVAGRALSERRERLGIVSELDPPTNGADAWGFTMKDWEETRDDLEWIWSIPLMYETRDFPIGVLNIDSNCPINETTATKIGELAKDMATVFTVVCANLHQP